jgi:putative transposase
MHRKPPPRLESATYIGLHTYFLTICVEGRRRLFADARLIAQVIVQLQQCSERYEFAVIAYCFMPDHLHLLVEGRSDRSDFREFVRVLKQRTAFYAKRDLGITLWQRGYYEHVLRSEESLEQKARYLLENPVRAGLVASPQEYPGIGSLTTTVEDLLQRAQDGAGPT